MAAATLPRIDSKDYYDEVRGSVRVSLGAALPRDTCMSVVLIQDGEESCFGKATHPADNGSPSPGWQTATTFSRTSLACIRITMTRDSDALPLANTHITLHRDECHFTVVFDGDQPCVELK